MKPRILSGPVWVIVAAMLATGAGACGPMSLDKAGSPISPISKPIVLTLADGEIDLSNAQPFAAAVWRLSHGTIRIKIEGNWRPTDPRYETDLIKDVRSGKAELGITASRAFDTVGINSFQALQAPFLINSYALERKVLNSQIPAKMLTGLGPAGLVGLAVLPGPLRRPLSYSRPLLAASDYKGARIGTRPSGVTADVLRALGAVPAITVRSPSGIRTTGLTGVEAQVYSVDTGLGVPGATLTGNVIFWPRPDVIFINQHAFSSLTAGQRSVLVRAAAKARSAGIYEGDDTPMVVNLCRLGTQIVSASPADLAGLLAAVQPVYRMLESDPSTRAYISQITAMRQAADGSPSAVTCPPQAAVPAGQITTAATPLSGTWQVTYTEKELAAAGADPNELVSAEGNWGQFTLTFRRGHWWQRLIGGDPGVTPNNLEAYGTYVVTGHRITFYRHDHTEIWGPYFWSVYRDTLTFKRDGWTGGTQGPTGLTVRPWRKTGT
jgi:TRAP-type C4-dicarboxylate transport system substrate-binding protein